MQCWRSSKNGAGSKRADSSARTRLTFSSGSTPVWSPAATTLAFTSVRGGLQLPYQRAADGTGSEAPLFPYDWYAWVNDWSMLAPSLETKSARESSVIVPT